MLQGCGLTEALMKYRTEIPKVEFWYWGLLCFPVILVTAAPPQSKIEFGPNYVTHEIERTKNPLPVQHWQKTAFCIGQSVVNNDKMQFSFTENEMRGQ